MTLIAIAALLAAPAVSGDRGGVDDPAAIDGRLDVIDRRVERLAPHGAAADDASVPRLRSELRRLRHRSLRQEGRRARLNDRDIRELERRLDTLTGPRFEAPRTGLETDRGTGGRRTRLITPAIPTTDLDPDEVFGDR